MKPGEKCATALIVASVVAYGDDALIARIDNAYDNLKRHCSAFGLVPNDIHLTWSGTIADARTTPHAPAVANLSQDVDDLLLFIYEATAA